MHREEIDKSIENAIEFIRASHLAQGEFLTEACADLTFRIGKKIFTVYILTYIVHSLGCVKEHPTAAFILNEVCRSLWRHREEGGIWRFFGTTKEYPPPDFDETCCALAVLKQNGWVLTQALSPSLNNSKINRGYFTHGLTKWPIKVVSIGSTVW